MRYKEYTDLKNSHLEWLDVMPSHWDGGRLRWFSHIYAGGTPSKEKEEYWDDGTVPWLNSGAVNQALINEPSAYITESAYANSSAKWIPKGALVMALAGQGKTKGMVAQLAIDTTCNQSMAAIVPNNMYNARYLYWWLNSNYQNIRNMAGGDLRDGLNLDILGNIQCPIPGIEEQKQIAAFLDRETQKIDRLIEKQQQLIKLLQEKRQVVISHAVTKGLNPNAKMKDSGVEWLGEIPEHWEAWKLSHFSPIVTCGVAATPEYVDDGVIFLSAQNIKNKKVDLKKGFKYITKEKHTELTKNRAPTKGDILLSRVGTIGEVCIVDVDFEFSIFVSLTHLRLNNKVCLNEYFIFLCESRYVRNLHRAVTLVGGGVGNLNVNDLKEYRLPIPPLEEQKQIVKDLRTKSSRMDTLIEKASQTIKLMKERRTALISAAVTGKIDVREAVNG
ncbi:MAG TPA: restriction endonuclease subunit S [Gammaproteobacteria bacterium]|nr:restriction endonuclease subunit S [Gammaproteobacteria bacterium]